MRFDGPPGTSYHPRGSSGSSSSLAVSCPNQRATDGRDPLDQFDLEDLPHSGLPSRRTVLAALGVAAATMAAGEAPEGASARRDKRRRKRVKRRNGRRASGGDHSGSSGAGPEPGAGRPRRVGTTFSQRQCGYLGLDVRNTFAQVCSLGLDLVRLCAYWDEIEPVAGQYDFTLLDELLAMAAAHGIPVALAVGMKAPRWPEFHFPSWVASRYAIDQTDQPLDAIPGLADQALAFVSAVVAHVYDAPGLAYWQIENEPFHALEITGNRYLSSQFVSQEAVLVRQASLPGQKLLTTTAINLWPPEGKPEDDDALVQAIAISDAVGINVYGKVPVGGGDYLEPSPAYWSKLQAWHGEIEAAGREAWIAELQAEPWEQGPWETVRNWATTPSSSPEQTTALMQRVARLGYDTVMLWGCEYWVYRQRQGDSRWWEAMGRMIG